MLQYHDPFVMEEPSCFQITKVEHYRRKLMKKTVAEQETPKRGRSPSASPERKSEKSKKKKRRRTRSSSRYNDELLPDVIK